MSEIDFAKLKEPMEHEWKVQRYVKDGAMGICVGFVNARQVMDRLDEVVGPDKWQRQIVDKGEKAMCGIGIKVSDEWVWKWDVGAESDIEADKGAASDAFKRAAVNWGIGRFLYDLDSKFVDIKDKKPVDKQGNRIYDLTAHFNGQTDDKKDSGKNGDSFKDKTKKINADAIVKRIKELETRKEMENEWAGLNTYARNNDEVVAAFKAHMQEIEGETLEDVAKEMEE